MRYEDSQTRADKSGILSYLLLLSETYESKQKNEYAFLRLDSAIGDTLRFSGTTTDFEMKLESMQIDHNVVESAAAGSDIGIAVPERVRRSDTVFRVSD